MKIKYWIIIVSALLLVNNLQYAQEKPAKVYEKVEVKPEFINGQNNLLPFIAQNVKYPEAAKKGNIHGKVLVEFVVDEKGNVTNQWIEKGIGAGCDEEALRVTKLLKFTPGKDGGQPVKVKMMLPYKFKLDGEKTDKTDKTDKNKIKM